MRATSCAAPSAVLGYTRTMRFASLVPALVVVTACGPLKGTSFGDDSSPDPETSQGGSADTTGTSGSTGTTATAGTTGTTDTPTTGAPACAGDPPACEPCGGPCDPFTECVDGEWQCGCDCNPTTGETAGETTGTSTGGSSDDTGSTTDGAEVQCTADPKVFPSFAEDCRAAADCAVVLHQVDCCGSLQGWGIRADAVADFDAAEAVCQSQYPRCDCPPMATLLDDGNVIDDVDGIVVDCVGGLCQSAAP
jgi:hypothetical protein